ncbi:glycosyltransferase [Terriglobus aquaticus]|uniref:Glycosyltransferase n=1 Tax=Terriglobus aquaticus TaxID=940139 RepID=A0ABW9KJY6_9BACT|nr:glycosyltransferase [Terriglobus aquaticus]
MPDLKQSGGGGACRVAVIWIDWYPYHVARMQGLCSAPTLSGRVSGVELVGGVGVHAGLKFRADLPGDLPVTTLMPEGNWSTANHWKLAWMLWRQLDRLNPEAVLVPGYYTLPGIAAALWARLHGRISILMTESAAYDHARRPGRELLKRLMLRALFDRAVVGGRDHAEYLRQLGFAPESVSRFYDVVDNDYFAAGAAEARRASSAQQHNLRERYFLYVGRLAPEKNVAGLLRAWLQYRAEGGTWDLVLAGDGPERLLLEETLSRSEIGDSVRITGLCTAKQLLPLYAFASAFVLASTREPWGLVVNEAMASGLPVIATDHCGCANDLLRDSGCGEIVPVGNEPALTLALHRMAQHTPATRAAMARAARERIRDFSPWRFGLEVASVVDRIQAHAQRWPQEEAL